jgi:hypothetical protein
MKTSSTVNVLQHFGYSSEQIGRMIAAAEGDGAVGRPKLSDVAASLRGVRSLSAEHRADALRALRDGGHVTDDFGDDNKLFAAAGSSAHSLRTGAYRMTPLQASEQSPQHLTLVKQLMARAKRLGYSMQLDQPVDLDAFDRAVAGKDINERLGVKSAMRQVGLV